MPKLVIVSDTHGQLSQVKVPGTKDDILIHCGDWTYLGEQREIMKFGRDLRKLPHKHKIIIPGNHDLTFDPMHEKFHKDRMTWLCLDERSHLLINESIVLDGIVFFGTPLICKIGTWAFGYSHLRKAEIYEQIQKADVVISHSPPYGILDEWGYGCPALLELIQRIKPRIHAFGHCHEDYGMKEIDGTLFVNASTCTRTYKATNKPIVVDLP